MSPHLARVVLEHERGLDHVRQRRHLLVAVHVLVLSSEKTRSAAAELGVNEPTMRIASAHL